MAEPRYILGVDLGTTSLKGALFEVGGALVGHHGVTYPTMRHADGRVEQDPADWLASFWTVVDRLLDGRDPATLVAVGICSQVNTYAFVDAAGQALAPAITWQDRRSEGEAARLNALVDPDARARWWPSGMAISATHMLPLMAWMAAARPDIWERTAKVLSPKDFLLRQLTGQWTADPLASFDLVDQAGHYIPALLALVPGAAERVAPLASYRSVVGRLSHPRLPGCSAMVVNGTMDAFGCLFGSGVSGPGEGSYMSGTSEIVSLVGDRPGGAPGIVSFAPVDGWHVQAGPTQSGGDTLRWLADLLSLPHAGVIDVAARADRTGEPGVLFLPHLAGERAPYWDAQARGSFLGMTSADGAPDLALAALEGVAVSARLIFERCCAAIGSRPDALYIGGTGNSADLWAQIRADVLGVSLHRVRCLDTGAVGAAIMAGLGAGLFPSIAAASRALVDVTRTFVPDPARAARYATMTARYEAAYHLLKDLYRR
ncbi:xylulokinase [Sphingomonas adhaesiva]|uniref:xylulokinase n=1 Tax=Sphingomonas adhaesiva TaxID=28212 RepID=UPI002FFC4379